MDIYGGRVLVHSDDLPLPLVFFFGRVLLFGRGLISAGGRSSKYRSRKDNRKQSCWNLHASSTLKTIFRGPPTGQNKRTEDNAAVGKCKEESPPISARCMSPGGANKKLFPQALRGTVQAIFGGTPYARTFQTPGDTPFYHFHLHHHSFESSLARGGC